jgi:NADPH-dependent glutamate synthase beta subunit-like oxidoreductase
MNKDAIDDRISFFLRSAVENETKVIGFDIQFSLLSNKNNDYVVATTPSVPK